MFEDRFSVLGQVDFFKLHPLCFTHQPMPSSCSQMVVHRLCSHQNKGLGWEEGLASRDSVLKIQISHLRPFKSVSERVS